MDKEELKREIENLLMNTVALEEPYLSKGWRVDGVEAIEALCQRLCIEARQDEIEKIMDYKGWVSENVFNAVRNQLDDRLEELESLKEVKEEV